jgi:hypothetical protein
MTPDETRVLALEKAFQAGERVAGQQWGPDNYVTAARIFLDFLAGSNSPKPDPELTPEVPAAPETPTPRQRPDDDIPQF